MKIELKERTREHVSIYWHKTQDEAIQKMIPQTIQTEEQALAMFEKSLLPDSTSYGKVIYVDGEYVGDVWCYAIGREKEYSAMISYTLFDKTKWGKGIATASVGLFLEEIFSKYSLKKVGAFTYSFNKASIKVLEKQGFEMIEVFEEQGMESKYFEKIG